MNIKIPSLLSTQIISPPKRIEPQMLVSVQATKKALDVQKSTGEALIKAFNKSALQTGKGINIDFMA